MLSASVIINGQDTHFSQTSFTPLLINPSYTGIFNGEVRIINNYRSQWKTINKAYSTLDVATDMTLNIAGKSFGAGMVYLNDISGNGALSSHKFHGSFSFHGFWKNNQISVGLQPGFVFREFDYGSITFPDQYNPVTGLYDSGMPVGEGLLDESISYFDLNAGVSWRKKIRNYLPSAGIALFHLNQPVESFNQDNNWPRVPVKYVFTGSVQIDYTDKIMFIPGVFFTGQQNAKEFITGGISAFELSSVDFARASVFGGMYMRTNLVKNFDALILMGGVNLNDFSFALNYDINMSSLQKASNFYGAFEFSIVYIYNRTKAETFKEPCLIF